MLKLKDALNAAAKTAKATPLAKLVGWTAGSYADRQQIRRENAINAAFCERETQIDAEHKRDIEAAWREHFREQRREVLAQPVYLGQ
jgi:tryptophan 2,3-dioxygenase